MHVRRSLTFAFPLVANNVHNAAVVLLLHEDVPVEEAVVVDHAVRLDRRQGVAVAHDRHALQVEHVDQPIAPDSRRDAPAPRVVLVMVVPPEVGALLDLSARSLLALSEECNPDPQQWWCVLR